MKKSTLFPKRKDQNRFIHPFLVLVALLCLGYGQLAAQCSPDVTPPTAVCLANLTVQSNLNGPDMTILNAALLDEGSFDNCSSNVLFRATFDLNATIPPIASEVQLVGLGDQDVVLWVGDAAGNWNQCITTVTKVAPKCNPDVTAPICVAPADMTITHDYYQSLNLDLQDTAQMNAAFGTAYHWDNCSNGNSFVAVSYSVVNYPGGSPKTITRSFWVFDVAGNSAPIAEQVINVLPGNSTVHIPGWYFPGDASVDSIEVVSGGSELLAASNFDQVYIAACNGQVAWIQRTISFIDWATYDPNIPAYLLPALDLDNDAQTGDPYDLVYWGDSLWRVENGQPVAALAPIVGGYKYVQIIRYNYQDTATFLVKGLVFLDTLVNCSLDTGEPKLANWTVKAIGSVSGAVYTSITDAQGQYKLFICPSDTAVEVSLDVPYDFGQSCPTVYPLTLQSGVLPVLQDIPVQLEASCPLLSVDLATLRIRPCFSDVYSIAYANLSDQLVPDVHVEVALDTVLHYDNSSIPGTDLGGNTYAFQIGDLQPGESGTFDIHFTTSCYAGVGLTYCSEAHIFPDTFCSANAAWSGAWLKASGSCAGDSVHLTLKNTGSGSMAAPLDFVIIEDLIMYMAQPFQLNAQEERIVSLPANGSTWRIQAQQETYHPWGGIVSAFVEGCGGLNQSGNSVVFPLNTPNPFVTTDCVVSVSSFDPNDKQAIPRGYADEHFIEKNAEIQYAIRFQNTGTDTAYTVVILDTLSEYVDVNSVMPGASSHHYDFDIVDGHVLRFAFDHILLPDSSTNLEASQGIVKYRIRQTPDNTDGTVILNSAAIYFDNNAAVITNTTYHTIGSNFVLVSTDETTGALGKLKAYPNPSAAEVFFEMPESVTEGRFLLTDALGKSVREANIAGNTYRFERKQLPAGVYFFNIQTSGGGVYTGKVLLK